MKTFLFLSLAILLASCCGREKEDEQFDPYPGGKSTNLTPNA